MPVVAHAGHWINYVVFLVPTLGFIAWLLAITVRDRQQREAKSTEAEAVRSGAVREVVATLTSYTDEGMAQLVFEDATALRLYDDTGGHANYEGRAGLAVVERGRLVDFRPFPPD